MRLACVLLASLAFAETRGLPPRHSASGYPAHAVLDGAEIAAELMDSEQVRRAFAAPIYMGYAVVEVAIYPGANQSLELDSMDFNLHLKGQTSPIRPSSARTIAGVLHRKQSHSSSDATVYGSVGYESGRSYDPVYGERRGGWRGDVGVAVATPGMGYPYPAPSSSGRDRYDTEMELADQALPEGAVIVPVAGYLYFPLPSKAKPGDATTLEYHGSSGKVEIRFPKAVKRR